jgi:RimJ/RimL family protein N-acetyltransferase
VSEQANVAVRPLRREDLDAFAAWGVYDDPLLRHYTPRALSPAETDALFRELTGTPERNRAYAGLYGERFIATLLLRDLDAANGTAEVGIVVHPGYLGRGLGPRILRAFAAVLAREGLRRLRLDVAAFNRRAIAAYRSVGFLPSGERWGEPEPGIDLATLLSSPAGGAVSPHVRREPGGAFSIRIIEMEHELPMAECFKPTEHDNT